MPSIQTILNRDAYLQDLVTRPMARRIVKEKNRFITEMVKGRLSTGMFSDELTIEHITNLREILNYYYGKIIRIQGIELLSILEKDNHMFHVKLTDDEDEMFAFMTRNWLARHGLAKARIVAETGKVDVRRAFTKLFEEGLDSKTIAKRMLDPKLGVKKLSLFRANTIARTEIGSASSFAWDEIAKDKEEKSGVPMLKKWIRKNDKRIRVWHWRVTTKWIDRKKKFSVGVGAKYGPEDMDHPHDPKARPENLINCRCKCIYKQKKQKSLYFF